MQRMAIAALLVALGAPAGAQQIVGATFVNTVGGPRVQLVTVGVGTGVVALIGAAPTDAATFTPITALDPDGDLYYFLAGPSGPLYAVSIVDGSFSSAALTGDAIDNLLDLEYDPGEGTLYAIARVATDELRLASVGVGGSLGDVQLLGAGSFQGGAALTYTFSDLDPVANRFYFVGLPGGVPTLYGVDTAAADIVDSGVTSAGLSGIEADSDSGALFGHQSTGAPTFDRRIVELSTTSGTFGSETGTGPGLAGEALSTAGFETSDPAGNRYFFLGSPASNPVNHLYAVDTTSLALADSDPLSGATTDPVALELDPLPTAAVTATKTVSGTFLVGGSVTYTVTLSNAGSGSQGDNPGDELVDVLPSTLALVSASASAGTATATVATNTVTWNGAIPAAGSVTVTLGATVLPGAAGTTVSNQGTIAFDGDADGANEASTVTDDPGTLPPLDPTSFTVPSVDIGAIPALDLAGLLLLAGALAAGALAMLRRG
jgi:uncharacterized repeat protein (TIGR01451 family)